MVESSEVEQHLNLRFAGAKRTNTHGSEPLWPVSVAEEISVRLFDTGKVTVLPDTSNRYLFGTLFMEWGVLRSLEHSREAAWFVGADDSEVIVLCGSVHHLRGMDFDGRSAIGWYPSRLFGMLEFMEMLAPNAREERASAFPSSGTPKTQESHQELLELFIGYSARAGRGVQQGWVDFLAEKHLCIPEVSIEGRLFRQAVLASPVWVADSEIGPPAGWYPDRVNPELSCLRWWDGSHWTGQVAVEGNQEFSEVPDGLERPVGRRLEEFTDEVKTRHPGVLGTGWRLTPEAPTEGRLSSWRT